MDKEKNIQTEEIINNRELITLLDKKIKLYLNNFQNSFVEFCKDMHNLQNEESFYMLSIPDQMKFNECIDDVSRKIKKDFTDLEKFYSNCKLTCYENFDKMTLDTSINDYINSSIKIQGGTHPCITDCMQLYSELTKRYYNYMVDGNIFFLPN